jgi:uncharacterized protein (TIGR00725 family)
MYNQPDIRDQWIALLGAAKRYEDFQLELGYRLGAAVAKAGKGLITGATTGIPLAAAIGAKDHGGRVLGISPAENPREHVGHFGKPLEFHDTILYTGLGNDGRSPMIVRSAAVALFAGGEAGTLQEFAAAWLNGVPVIGILEGSGGISDKLLPLAESFQTSFGSTLVADSSPDTLVTRCLETLGTLDGTNEPSQATRAVLDSLEPLRKEIPPP